MPEFTYQVKIPKDRIAVLIGKSGETKKYLEEQTKTVLAIDSNEGDVTVSGEDAISLYSTRDIIRAIGRGFNPEIAMQLLKQDYAFEIINLPDFEKPTQFMRIKGRIIGRNGRSRQLIEEHTETSISVYGKTVSIIGLIENVSTSRRAIEMIIKGSPHSNVYKWLERMKRDIKRREYTDKFEDFMKKPADSKNDGEIDESEGEESPDGPDSEKN